MLIKNLREAFASTDTTADRGDLVQTVLLLAGFAIVAIVIVTWLGNAIMGAAADVSECITSSNSFTHTADTEACENNDKSSTAQDLNTDSDAWDSRFG